MLDDEIKKSNERSGGSDLLLACAPAKPNVAFFKKLARAGRDLRHRAAAFVEADSANRLGRSSYRSI